MFPVRQFTSTPRPSNWSLLRLPSTTRRARSEFTPPLLVVPAQDGFALIEVLVSMVLLGIVIGALMAPLVTAADNQTRDANYAFAQEQARVGLNSIVSQVRQAYEILSTSGNSVAMNVSVGGVAEEDYFECDVPQPGTSYHECVRVQAPVGSALPPLSSGTVVITNLTNGTAANPVFSFSPSAVAPDYMTATIEVPASDGAANGLRSTITFSDGALMRNLNVQN